MTLRRAFLIMLIGALSILMVACEFSLAADITPPPVAPGVITPERSSPTSIGPDYPLLAPSPSNGAMIYAEKCEPCHGPNGLGDGPQAGQLPNPVPPIGRAERARLVAPAEWYQMVTQGNIERFMPPFSSLTVSQRWDVVAFVFNMSTDSSEIEAGRTLYEANCAVCHGESGRGDGPAGVGLNPGPTNFTNQEWMAQRSNADLYTAIQAGVDPGMPAFAGQFGDTDTWAVAAYLRSISFGGGPAGTAVTSQQQPPEESEGQPAVETEVAEGEVTREDDPSAQADEPPLGIVRGTLVNGSGGALPTEILVTLHALDHMQLVYTTTTTLKEDGSYIFEDVEFFDRRVFVVTADYGGTTYGSDVAIVETGKSQVELPLTIYDTTSETSALVIDRLHVFFDITSPDWLQVVQLYVISNPSNKTVVANEESGAVAQFTLPEGATNLQFQDGVLGGRYRQTPDGFADTAPVRPGQGQYQVMYAFDLPYDRKLDISQTFKMPLDAMIFMTPADGIRLRSNLLQDAGQGDVQGQAFQMYTGGSLEPGQALDITISGSPTGTAVIPFLSAVSSGDSLVIGLAALGLVLVVAGVYMYRRSAKQITDADLAEAESESIEDISLEEDEVELDDPEAIMDEIILLDDLYTSGEIPEDTYLSRRTRLKNRLRDITD
jgi:mono/diheme cytochrome c family protein